jgi:hypothetical protein
VAAVRAAVMVSRMSLGPSFQEEASKVIEGPIAGKGFWQVKPLFSQDNILLCGLTRAASSG